ncbi:SMC-Scp complex subunit ScpB [Enterococcus nangangensis]|uniref:SMC-Scp complex subunit ScpB n=1 Tax=Enterococcus nangangensis TaxID=2559926 RepID=UPI001FEAC16B|nr:SMC-Scp complex subunit ScpB [Enterococcus nangangensis]
MNNYLAQLEALLFVAGGKGVSLGEFSLLLGLSSGACLQQLEKLKQSYEEDSKRSFTLLETGERYQLVTKPQFKDLLESFAKAPTTPRLSQAALETLAIVAYKQPIPRLEIDEIRGVQSTGALQTLTMRQLVEEKGRQETPGRPILYGTTAYFLDYFGLQTLTDLPDIAELESETTTEIPDLFFNEATLTNPLPDELTAE